MAGELYDVRGIARRLAEERHYRSLALLVAGYADFEYPLNCRECRLAAERRAVELISESGLKPLLVAHEPGFLRFHIVAWEPGSERVVLFSFGHGGYADARRMLSLVHALAALRRRGILGGVTVSKFAALRDYLRRYRGELERHARIMGVGLGELLEDRVTA